MLSYLLKSVFNLTIINRTEARNLLEKITIQNIFEKKNLSLQLRQLI